MTNPITHATIAAELDRLIAHVERANRGCEDNLMNGESRRVVLAEMSGAFRVTGRRLVELRERVEESAQPAPAGRPLQAVLADIRAEGHVFILSSTTDSCTLSTWLKGVDNLKSQSEYGSVCPALAELPAAAEARLAQIRELHTAAVAELDESSEEEGLVWDRNEYRETTTSGPEEVDTEHEASEPERTRPCPKCDGCGQVADTDDQELWSAWMNLPIEVAGALRIGLVKPIPCPLCGGQKDVAAEDARRPAEASEEGQE